MFIEENLGDGSNTREEANDGAAEDPVVRILSDIVHTCESLETELMAMYPGMACVPSVWVNCSNRLTVLKGMANMLLKSRQP